MAQGNENTVDCNDAEGYMMIDKEEKLVSKPGLFERMEQRNKERQQDRTSQQIRRELATAKKDEYLKELEDRMRDITEEMDKAFQEYNDDPQHIVTRSDEILENISRQMQNFNSLFAEGSSVLMQHHVKRTQDACVALKTKFEHLQDCLRPKKKFGFKSRKTTKTCCKSTKDKIENKSSEVAMAPYIANEDSGYKVLNPSSLNIIDVPTDEVKDRDVILEDLSNCTVKILGTPGTLVVVSSENIILLCGPVKTSIFVDNCRDCCLVIACQQLRVHSTRDTDIYLHVTASGIVEDCRNVRFAPYTLHYQDLDKHFFVSGLNREINNWDKIGDFNWLSSDQPSPNWSIIPDVERKGAWLDDNC